MVTHRDIVLSTLSEDTSIRFLQFHNIIRKEWLCNNECGYAYVKFRKKENGYCFECTKCHSQKQLKVGSILENKNLGFTQFIDFLYFWCKDLKQEGLREESCMTSMETSGSWAEICRCICENHLLELDEGLIGGPGVEIEIDESKFSKRKYNVGRSLRKGWVFGGIERDSRRSFFEFVDDRTEETLLGVIKRRVREGSIIHSDKWAAYQKLSLHGYVHFTVNHSKNFIDPITGSNTQKIESSWSHMKQYLRSKGRNLHSNMSQYFSEFLFKQKYKGDIFGQMLLSISQQYRIN